MSGPSTLTCRMCGQEHRNVPLSPGEKALCLRCDTVLAKGRKFGPDGALAFSVTGVALAVPACMLPFVTAGKFGEHQVSLLFSGVGALWGDGMRTVALVVLLCGALMPLGLLATLAALHAPARLGWFLDRSRSLAEAARWFEHWSIPEVQVLAVLVALIKLGSLVTVKIGPGFWSYCGMSLSLLLAQRSFDFEPSGTRPIPSKSKPSVHP